MFYRFGKPVLAFASFDESKHPRGKKGTHEGGKFVKIAFLGAKGMPGSYGSTKTDQFKKAISDHGGSEAKGLMNQYEVPASKIESLHAQLKSKGFGPEHYLTNEKDIVGHGPLHSTLIKHGYTKKDSLASGWDLYDHPEGHATFASPHNENWSHTEHKGIDGAYGEHKNGTGIESLKKHLAKIHKETKMSEEWPDAVLCLSDAELELTNDPLEFWKEICKAGDFTKGDTRFSIDTDFLDWMHESFAEMSAEGMEVPVPVEHTNDPEKRRGTLKETRRQINKKGEESLFGRIRFRDADAAKLAALSNVSVYVPKKRENGRGKVWPKALGHVAITDYPVICDLEPFEAIVMSFDESKHPRGEKGTHEGGKFVGKEGESYDERIKRVKKWRKTQKPYELRRLREIYKLHVHSINREIAGTTPYKTAVAKRDAFLKDLHEKHGLNENDLLHATGSIKAFSLSEFILAFPPEKRPAEDGVEDEAKEQTTLRDVATMMGIPPEITDEQELLQAMKQKLSAPMPQSQQPMPMQQPMMHPMTPMPRPGYRPGVPPMSQEEEVVELSGSLLSTVKNARQVQLDRLLETGHLTPPAKKLLEERYLTDEVLKFSHLGEDGFDAEIETIKALGTRVPTAANKGSRSGAQTLPGGVTALELSQALDPNNNALIRDAERRAKSASR